MLHRDEESVRRPGDLALSVLFCPFLAVWPWLRKAVSNFGLSFVLLLSE